MGVAGVADMKYGELDDISADLSAEWTVQN